MAGVGVFEKEKFLLETLERVSKKRSEYKLLYVNISKLKPKNRHPRFVKIIAQLFDDLVSVAEGSLFVLSNGDCVVLGKNLTEKNVNNAVEKLRRGLITDPIWTSQGAGEFTHLYEPNDFEKVVEHIEALIQAEPVRYADIVGRPLDAGQVEVVKARLDEMNIVELVKHQKVLRLDSASSFRILFEEFFVAVKDLSRQFDKDIDLTANKWLFLYLTETLDKKTMYSFSFSDIKNKPEKISLNLNLSTIFSAEFEEFTKKIAEQQQTVVAEVQAMDIINNLTMYFDAKELLHRSGNEILIDATNIEMLQAFQIDKLGADYLKIFWHALMGETEDNSNDIKNILESIGTEKIILAKCLDEKALRWGIKNGIRSFQGPYMDMLDVALTRNKCPNGRICTAEDCLKRKRYIAGAYRDACAYKDFLEGKPE